jgi:hypothetical protein
LAEESDRGSRSWSEPSSDRGAPVSLSEGAETEERDFDPDFDLDTALDTLLDCGALEEEDFTIFEGGFDAI